MRENDLNENNRKLVRFSVHESLLNVFDQKVRTAGYTRSEALRRAMRLMIGEINAGS